MARQRRGSGTASGPASSWRRLALLSSRRRLGAIAFASLACTGPAFAAPIDVTADAMALANALLGANSGFTLLEAGYTGAAGAAGLQSTGTGLPGNAIAPGIILTTGSAAGATGPASNLPRTQNGTPGSAALEAFAGSGTSSDAATLTLKLQGGATASKGKFSFNLGTDDNSGGIYNDTFAAFLSSTGFTGNVAFDAQGNALRINSTYYPPNPAVTDPTTAYDRQTGRLNSIIFDILPNEVFTLSFAIADFGDADYDSGAYLAELGVLLADAGPGDPGSPNPLEGLALKVDFVDPDGPVLHDTVTVNSVNGAVEVAGGDGTTSLGGYLFPGEAIDAVAGRDGEGNLVLLLDLALCGNEIVTGICGPSGEFKFSGWGPDLTLLGVSPLNIGNVNRDPTFVFDGDSFTVDWLPADGFFPEEPVRIQYALVFGPTSVAEPESFAALAAALAAFAGLRARRGRKR